MVSYYKEWRIKLGMDPKTTAPPVPSVEWPSTIGNIEIARSEENDSCFLLVTVTYETGKVVILDRVQISHHNRVDGMFYVFTVHSLCSAFNLELPTGSFTVQSLDGGDGFQLCKR